MNDARDVSHPPSKSEVNPFATRYTRPAAIPPVDESGTVFDPGVWLDALDLAGGCGAFVGPHGSGKSTRLEACGVEAASRGQNVERLCLRRRREVARAAWRLLAATPGSLVCVDGLERAGPVFLRLLRPLARWRRVRLLATLHDAHGLPVIARCETSRRLLETLVGYLPDHGGRVSAADVSDAYTAAEGNLREAFFLLYDRFEARRGSPGCSPDAEANGRADRAD